jgi:hypothetical protein
MYVYTLVSLFVYYNAVLHIIFQETVMKWNEIMLLLYTLDSVESYQDTEQFSASSELYIEMWGRDVSSAETNLTTTKTVYRVRRVTKSLVFYARYNSPTLCTLIIKRLSNQIHLLFKGILKLILVILCISWKLAIGSINDIYETLGVLAPKDFYSDIKARFNIYLFNSWRRFFLFNLIEKAIQKYFARNTIYTELTVWKQTHIT